MKSPANTAATLSKAECQVLKGMAILSIMLHNLCHLTPGVARGTNEFFFSEKAAANLWNYLLSPGWDLPLALLSFLGQTGVQVFLFLSAYGLVLKYERGATAMPRAGAFLRQHYLKLWRLMAIGLVIAIAVGAIMHTRFMSRPEYWPAQLLMVTNLLPRPDLNIFPGPYWYLGVTLEVYVIYRLLLYCPRNGAAWRGWVPPVLFVLLTWVVQLLVPAKGDLITYLRYNFFIAGVPFSAGVLMARYGRVPQLRRRTWAAVALAAAALFVAMQFGYGVWLWSSLPFIVMMAALVKVCGSGALARGLGWVGGVSAAAFIVHPIVRMFCYSLLPRGVELGQVYVVTVWFAVASLALASAYSRLVAKLPSPKTVTDYHAS